MTVILDTLKLNLRLDGDEDDLLLNTCLKTAQILVQDAVCDGSTENAQIFFKLPTVEPLIDTAVLAEASSLYENRSASTPITVHSFNAPYNAIIGTLRGMWYNYIQKLEKSTKQAKNKGVLKNAEN